MTPIEGMPIVTAAEMRAAEATAMAAGATIDTLMERAGRGVAAAAARLGAGAAVLVLCGPGNNGGDGYIAAAALQAGGLPVRVAASGPPATDAARRARAGWAGPVKSMEEAGTAPIVIDALFGTGLTRPLDTRLAAALTRLVEAAHLAIAVDLPSGVPSDDGAVSGQVPCFHLTLALGAVKPAHLLQPAARHCGQLRLLDIGVAGAGDAAVLARPALPSPGPDSQKFSRGMVAVIAGAMRGASLLTSVAAMRSGAGYVVLLGGDGQGPHALVHRPLSDAAWADRRIGAVVIGPGLGRDDEARAKLDAALTTAHPLIIDGDALHLLGDGGLAALRARTAPAILTPHTGEFDALFGAGEGSKIDRARAAAKRANAVVVFKGADTVIAAPDGKVRVACHANDWLSTAGTGDVLTGGIAAQRAGGLAPLDAAAAGVWLHADAARRLGRAFIADDLADMLTASRAAL